MTRFTSTDTYFAYAASALYLKSYGYSNQEIKTHMRILKYQETYSTCISSISAMDMYSKLLLQNFSAHCIAILDLMD